MRDASTSRARATHEVEYVCRKLIGIAHGGPRKSDDTLED
jgi:hypothetical protein